MKNIYTVYYYVVGKTYTEGCEPHSIDVEIVCMTHNIVQPFFDAVIHANDELHRLFNKYDTYTFVRVEKKNYQYD
jgi:hypothetical protein